MKAGFDDLVEAAFMHGKMRVDLFTGGTDTDDGNSMCHVYHSIPDDAGSIIMTSFLSW